MSFDYQVYYPILDAYGGPVLVAVFVFLLLLEHKFPLRRIVQKPSRRLLINALVSVPTMIVLRLALVPALVLAASYAEQNSIGLLNLISMPSWIHALAGFLLLDYSLYVWHVLSHRVPLLWRFHNVHHTDLDLGVSTAIRFHFVEMFLSGVFRTLAVLLIGASPTVVLIYEVAFQAWVAFQHSNWRLATGVEQVLIKFFVTPRMHGIHHSNVQAETNSNFSNVLNAWDHIHGTMRLNVPQDSIVIGVPAYRNERELSVLSLLAMPFKKQRDYWNAPDTQVQHSDDSVNKKVLVS